MGLFAKLQSAISKKLPRRSGSAKAAVPVSGPEDLERVRTAARQRLIGAAMLLLLGIIGFPLLFETQPRNLPSDVVIETPARDAGKSLELPAVRSALDQAAPDYPAPPAEPAPPPEPVAKPKLLAPSAAVVSGTIAPVAGPSASRASASAVAVVPARSTPVEAPRTKSEPAAASAPARKPEPVVQPKLPESRPKPEPVRAEVAKPKVEPIKPAKADNKLDKPDKAAEDGRFVVQVGAFAEANGAREARTKVEALGLKTYTQVIESSSGRRIRVRVGPYATKAEAERAAARLHGAGLSGNVLVL